MPFSDSKTSSVHIRRAESRDAVTLLNLVDALADYERLSRPDQAAKQRLLTDCFGDKPRFESLIAEIDGKGVGYAFFFETYSSFLALPTLYIEDLFVLSEYRKQKIGISLFRAVAKEALTRGCGRMEWTVLDWNKSALDFYETIGAKHMKEWCIYRLVQSDLSKNLEA